MSAAPQHRRIGVRPLSGALGAEISGADLSRPLDDETWAEIRQAFLDHLVIFFRDQRLDPGHLLAFAKRFGPIGHYPFMKDMDEYPGVSEMVKREGDRVNFGGLWHSDTTYLETPPLGSVLYACEVPPRGGDTLFANMYLAYETLSESMKRLLDGLHAVNTAALRGAQGSGQRVSLTGVREKGANIDKMDMAAEHPVVRTHPDTGRKALYVNGAHTSHFAGMTREESTPILRYLFDHCARPEFSCRFSWTVGALAVWDNRCSQHYALNDYYGFRRVMQRITIAGDRPV